MRRKGIAIALRDPVEMFKASDLYMAKGYLALSSGCYEPHLPGIGILIEELGITYVLSELDMEEYWRSKGLTVISKTSSHDGNAKKRNAC